jgi:chemotaxis protein methyltransferase CheR
MGKLIITDREFAQFQRFIHAAAGITLSSSKKALVGGRLAKQIQTRKLGSYGEYFQLLMSGEAPDEVQRAVDLLTTNETYFFREGKHFELLRELADAHRGLSQPFRVWSAASSTGEEAYSIAMVLADRLRDRDWEVLGSDISSRVLERARRGHYPLDRATHVPDTYLRRYCLKGHGAQQGTLLIDRALRNRVRFEPVNLNERLPALGSFDVVFLRNVMIYFDGRTKSEVVERILPTLRRGGHFVIGHSETLNGISDAFELISPSVYRRP